MFEQRHAPPKKKQVRHVYSQLHFDTNVRPALVAELERMELSGEAAPKLQTVNRITKACWENEPADFRASIREIVDEMYESAIGTYTSFMEEMASADFVSE